MQTNEQVLALVYKIRDGQEFEIKENGIVIMKMKQAYMLQRFLRKLGKYITEYKKIELDI